jgi:hypothetical protein
MGNTFQVLEDVQMKGKEDSCYQHTDPSRMTEGLAEWLPH